MSFTEDFQTRLFSPWVALPAVYLIFLGLAFLAYRIPETAQFLLSPRGFFSGPPSTLSYLVSLLGLLVFVYACILGRRVKVRSTPVLPWSIFLLTALTLKLAFHLEPHIYAAGALGYALLLLFVSRRLGEVERITLAAIGLALLFALSILVKGVPILEAEARLSAAVSPERALFHGFATFGAVMLVLYQPRRYAFPGIILLGGLGALAGFKSDAVAVLISSMIAGLLTRRVSLREAVFGAALVVFLLTLLSNFIAETAYGGWRIHPLLYPLYRAGFTMGVFSEIVRLSMPFGYLKGSALLSVTQEIASTAVLGYPVPHIITSTLLGPGMLDFGLLGVGLTAFFLGFYLGAVRNSAWTRLQLGIYAIALTHVFILVEVGLQLTSIIYLLSLLYLYTSGGKK
jgi:hypothetical protein